MARSSFKAFVSASSPSSSRKVSSVGRLLIANETLGFNKYLLARISRHSPSYLDEIYLVSESSCNKFRDAESWKF